jgi:hypothetical protein
MIGHRPTDDTPAKRIEHNRDEQKTGQRGHIRDIRNPELVGSRRGKFSVEKIWRWSRISISNRRGKAFSPRGALKVSFAHQTRDAAIAHAYAFVPEVRLQPRPTVIAARLAMQHFDSVAEQDVTLASL